MMFRLVQGIILSASLIGGGAVLHQSAPSVVPMYPSVETSAIVSDAAALKVADAGEVIDKVWAGQPVGFAILVSEDQVFVGYYDADRQLTVAQRARTGGAWTYKKLNTHVGWDSHNYIAMTFDSRGRLHVAANMHASPLNYYMSDTSGAVNSLKSVPMLVDKKVEQQMTYPVFLQNAKKQLILKYRDGHSGDGNEIYDIFDDETATWRHLTDTPIADGQGKRNAYFSGPILGPDGYFHMDWVWRDTYMAETNHDLSYARSLDLIHWEKADGTPIKLPITLGNSEIVDPVPAGGGIINGNTPLGFDAQKRTVIAYHKYDAQGNTQIYVARWENAKWHISQASDWKNYRWDFKGGGTLRGEISLGRPQQQGDQLIVPVTRLGKSTQLRLNAASLTREGEVAVPQTTAVPVIAGLTSASGMILNRVSARSNGDSYTIGWLTQPSNRDLPTATTPAPSELVLFPASQSAKAGL